MKIAKISGDIPLIGLMLKYPLSNDFAASLILHPFFPPNPYYWKMYPETTPYIKRCLDMLEVLGVTCSRLSHGRYLINASGLSTFEVPFNEGRAIHVMLYIVGPLLYRFGKAIIPKPHNLSKRKLKRIYICGNNLALKF